MISGEMIGSAVGGFLGAGGACVALMKLLIRAAIAELRLSLKDDFLPRTEAELLQASTDGRLERLEATR